MEAHLSWFVIVHLLLKESASVQAFLWSAPCNWTESCALDAVVEGDLEITVTDSVSGSFMPSFRLRQNDLLLIIIINYVPSPKSETVAVNIKANITANCTFEVAHESMVRTSEFECLYPVLFSAIHFKPGVPAIVQGGDILKLSLWLSTNVMVIQDTALFLNRVHPSLHLSDKHNLHFQL